MTVDDAVLHEAAFASDFTLYQSTDSSPRGLTERQAIERLSRCGENLSRQDRLPTMPHRLVAALRSPFVGFLGALGVVFVLLGDARSAITLCAMVSFAVALRVWQHGRAARTVAAMCTGDPATASVRRRYDEQADPVTREVPVEEIVVGDVVMLQAGDVVPADIRITTSRTLEIDQSMLTGETLPVGKAAQIDDAAASSSVIACPRLCFAGTVVVGGSASGVVVGTGSRTYSGALRDNGSRHHGQSSVDRGVRAVSWTLVQFMLVMAPVAFVVRGAVEGEWSHAALLAVAVAVGLTPEMLPVIVTTTLARGATRLAARGVVVNRLDAIQDLGAVEVLCVDKTGTLTEDRVVYAHSVDASGALDDLAAQLAVVAAACGDGIRGRFDDAIAFVAAHAGIEPESNRRLVDEVPFDHRRRRASVVVTNPTGGQQIICQGDVDAVMDCSTSIRLTSDVAAMDEGRRAAVDELVADYRGTGMQVLAVAVRDLPTRLQPYTADDENRLTLVGFVVFVDPVRAHARAVIGELESLGVALKMITGDARTVAAHVATQVGIPAESIMVGDDVDLLDDDALRDAARATSTFAEMAPTQKARIVAALRTGGTAVGFVGDGVNDVAVLRSADVGVAADTATDAAKEAADLIMLQPDLRVLVDGVVEGRRTLGNTTKYVRITASSNFGNALSVLAAGLLLPILPILPVQLLVQNLLYDVAQLALPWDRVDPAYLATPRRWRPDGLIRFMVTFGVLSSAFDGATFTALWVWFGGAHASGVFQTGWFLEGLLSQLAIVMVLRGRSAPWRSPRPRAIVVFTACVAAAVGLALPISSLANLLRLQPLPMSFACWLLLVLVAYSAIAYRLKLRYLRRVDDVP